MNILESLVALVLLVGLPLVLLAWFLGVLRRSERQLRLGLGPFQRTVTTDRAIDKAVQTLQTSVVHQLGTVAHITVQAIGYILARLQGEGPNSIVQVTRGGETLHVVRVNKDYALGIHYRRARPDHYRGATVKLQDLKSPVALELTARGDGLEIDARATEDKAAQGFASGGGNLIIEPGQDGTVALRLTPRAMGPTTLSIEVFRGEEWVQRITVNLNVRSGAEVDDIARSARRQDLGAEQIAAVENLETAATLCIRPDPRERRVHLRCRACGSGAFNVAAKAQDRPWRSLKVTLGEDDVAEVNEMLRQRLDDLRSCFGDDPDVADAQQVEESRRQLLEELANSGRAALNLIFRDQEDRKFLRHAMGEGFVDDGEEGNVEISTDRFFLPWELLYDDPPERSAGFQGFWGFRYNISRVLTNGGIERSSPLIAVHGMPRVLMFANTELEQVRENEVPYLHSLSAQNRIVLHDWTHALAAATPVQDPLRCFIEFCRNRESELAHFACHAVADSNIGLESYLELSSELRIRLLDMSAQGHVMAGAPLVLLNACGTGIRDPRRTSNFVTRFMLSGGRGVLATECDVPDGFASRFLERVYEPLLAGETLGLAVLAARRHFLATKANPLGLLYAVYAPLETRLDYGTTRTNARASERRLS